MLKFAKLPFKERAPYFKEVANKRGLRQIMVEKDFWVCFILECLFTVPKLKENLVFKGGTSLSKVFGIIKRFSEDIDVTIDPIWFDFDENQLPERAATKSQQKKRHSKLCKKCTTTVQDEILPILEEKLVDKIGPNNSRGSYLSFSFDEKSKSPTLIFNYPTKENDFDGYIKPRVKLEFGSHTGTKPNGVHTISSWVAEEFPEIFKEPKFEVVCLDAERTFWEKATILHAEHNREKTQPMRMNLSRDLYDLCCMAEHESGQRALGDFHLLEMVVKHKMLYFYSAWAKLEKAQPGSLCLVPPDHRLSELESDYTKMQEEMFFEESPNFNELISKIKDIENHINKR